MSDKPQQIPSSDLSNVHICRGIEQNTVTEKEYLVSLSKKERAFLSRRSCSLCSLPLNKIGCSAIYRETGDYCTPTSRINRRKECLKTYKPRRIQINEEADE
jgi:hypothetical protein